MSCVPGPWDQHCGVGESLLDRIHGKKDKLKTVGSGRIKAT